MRDLGPGVPGIGGLEQSTPRTTAIEIVGAASGLPETCVQDARILRIHAQVAGAGIWTAKQDFVPGLAAISGTEHATLVVGSVRVAERGDVDEVGIVGVHADFRDVAGIRQTEVVPAFAGVGRAVHAVAVGHIAANTAFAHANVNDIRIGGGDCQGPD